jgi:hypothetical protein
MRRRPKCVLSVEAKFTSLQDGLRRNHDGFYDIGVKVSAALAVALGWFAVQENPLPQLCLGSATYLFVASVIVLTLCWLAVAFVFYQRYRSSCANAAALAGIGVPAPIYSSDVISLPALVVGIVFQLTIFICVGMSIWLVYPPGLQSKPCELSKAEKDARLVEAKAKLLPDMKAVSALPAGSR